MKGAEAVIGADVGGRLFPADMLFAGAQGEDETAFPLLIDGLAGEAAGNRAHVFLAHGEETDMGAAEGGRNAEALPFPDDDIGPEFARRFEEAEGCRLLDGHHQFGPLSLNQGREGRECSR